MNEKTPGNKSFMLLLALVSALFIVVGIQAWHMAGMREQLTALQAQTAAPTVIAEDERRDADAGDADRVTPSGGADDRLSRRPQDRQTGPRSPFGDRFDHPPFSRDWDPFQEMQRMQREMDEIFNNAFGRFHRSPDFGHLLRDGTIMPEIDVQENDKEYIVKVNVPGTDENNISVTLENQLLTIEGEQQFEEAQTDDRGNTLYRERRSGSYRRSMTLPEPVSDKGMKTHIENGVLTITIPKAV